MRKITDTNSMEFKQIIEAREVIKEVLLGSLDYFWSCSFLEKILAIEASLFIVIIVTLILYHEVVQRKLNKMRALQARIYQYLLTNLIKEKKLGRSFFKKNILKLNVIVPVLEKLNVKYKMNKHWTFLLNVILNHFLLDIARENATAFFWIKRYWSLRCLALSPRMVDEPIFLNFLLDPVVHIRFAAIRPLLSLKSTACADPIVDAMKGYNRHTQALYISMMKFGEDRFFNAIRSRLENESDNELRSVCIDIMSESLSNTDIFLIKKDIHSSDKSLKLTSIRCLNKFKFRQVNFMLMDFLKDKDWEVRAISARFLGERKAKISIPLLLQLASDQNWWVRMNSIMALKKMDFEGNQALNTISPEKDKFAFEMLKYLDTVDAETAKQNGQIIELSSKIKKAA